MKETILKEKKKKFNNTTTFSALLDNPTIIFVFFDFSFPQFMRLKK